MRRLAVKSAMMMSLVAQLAIVSMTQLGGAHAAPPGWGQGPGNGHGPPPHAPAHGRRMRTPPPRSSDDDEMYAADLMAKAVSGLTCESAGESLRRLSNQLLAGVSFATERNVLPPAPGDRRGKLREQQRQKWRDRLRSPVFWQRVWDRMSDAYRDCDRTCFDDGVAVGQISGSGYCAASVGVGGLPAPGYTHQAPLPLCQNSIFVGCQSGYRQASRTYDGCQPYTEGLYEQIFKEYQSQDCHLDNGF